MDPMKGKVVRNPSTEIQADEFHRFDFKNETNTDICDFRLGTNRTFGDDPDIRGLRIASPDGSTVYFNDDTFPDTLAKHVKLKDGCIPPGADFKILVKFDAAFESDESIEFIPSDEDGAFIEGPREEEISALPSIQKEFSLGELGGWTLGGIVGGGLALGLVNYWTIVALLPCIISGASGGGLAGGFGYIFAHFLDDALIQWNPRSTFLFGVYFTLAFAVLFGLLAIDLEVAAIDAGFPYRVPFGVGFVSGFLASALSGILNTLRSSSRR